MAHLIFGCVLLLLLEVAENIRLGQGRFQFGIRKRFVRVVSPGCLKIIFELDENIDRIIRHNLEVHPMKHSLEVFRHKWRILWEINNTRESIEHVQLNNCDGPFFDFDGNAVGSERIAKSILAEATHLNDITDNRLNPHPFRCHLDIVSP
jgi:hypothetical protein